MDYGIAIVIAALFFAMYAENKYQREQIRELRRVMDYQFDGLRYQFTEVKDLLSWIEPQLKMHSFNGMYVAARHADLKSIDAIREAVDAGRYHSAMLPMTEYTPRVNSTASP
jgi:hypothetical protein